MSAFARTYGVAATAETAIFVNLLKYATPTDYAVAADWTPAAGDVKVSKDDGAAANIATLPSYVTDKGWKFVLSATELTAKQVVVRIADSATKAVCDDQFIVETYGNASAMLPDTYSSSNPIPADMVRISGDSTAADNLESYTDGTTQMPVGVQAIVGDEDAAVNLADAYAGGAGYPMIPTFGAAQDGTTGTITLAASASATDDDYNGMVIVVRHTDGEVEWRVITDYNGTTKVATVDQNWSTTPTSSSRYLVATN